MINVNKQIAAALITLFIFLACKSSPVLKYRNVFFSEKGCLPFIGDDSISDHFGNPVDSFSGYLPAYTVYDSLWYFSFYDASGRLHLLDNYKYAPNRLTKESVSRQYNIPADKVYDSLVLQPNSYIIKRYSYSLYKMGDPVLCNYFLNKKIFRLTYFPINGSGLYTISVVLDHSKTYVYVKHAIKKIRLLKAERDFKLDIDTVKSISQESYLSLDSLFKKADVGSMIRWLDCRQLDNANFLIEIHSEQGYCYVNVCDLKEGSVVEAIIKKFLSLANQSF